MCKDLISIIVPVYNVEKYLEKCLDSLVNQTYKNIEIIVVDDGSTDSSGLIAEQYSSMYENVNVIHTENGGLSAARNVGINCADGEYIAFVDSDDWVDCNTYEILLGLINKGQYDFVSFGLLKEFGTETQHIVIADDFEVYNKKEIFCEILDDNSVAGYAWNKLIKQSVIGDERFDESLLSCEDIDFCVRIAAKSQNVIHTKSNFYHYRQRIDSMTGDLGYSERKLSVIKAYEKIMPEYKKYDFEDYYKLERNFLKINLNIKGRMIVSKVHNNAVEKMLNDNIDRYYPIVMKNTKNNLSTRLNISFTKMFPALLLEVKQFVLSKRRG